MGVDVPSRASICPGDLWHFPVQDFLVLARPDVSGLYILSPSARLIWDSFSEGVPPSELVQQFASAYDIPAEVAGQDVAQTLDHWRRDLLSPQREPFRQNRTGAGRSSSGPDCFARDYLVQGKNVRVLLQTLELAREIAPRLDPLPSAPCAPDFIFRVVEEPDGFCIFSNENFLAHEEGVSATRSVLLQEIVRCCRGGGESLAIFHAGACGSDTQCVILPGSTQSGKTTLAAVLMKMGLMLYSDDSVLLERDTLTVPAMPFALMIREGSWEVLHPRFPELREAPALSRYGQRVRFLRPIAAQRDNAAARPAAIVFPRFQPDGANEISPLDTLQTLLRLQESGFWVAHDEQSIRAFLEWLQTTASFSMSYSDVDQAAAIVRRLVT